MNELPRSIAELAPRLARRLAKARDADEALRVLLDEVVAATGVDAGAAYRWDVERTLLVRVATTAPPPDFDGVVHPGQGPIGEAAQARAPRVVARTMGAPIPDGLERWGLGCAVAVPLVHADHLAGAVVVGRRSTEDATSAGDLDLLNALAALAGPVVALAGREAAARRQYEALSDAAPALAHDLNNDLTMPIGALELMRDRPDLPADVQELIVAAAEDLTRVEERVRVFQRVARGGR